MVKLFKLTLVLILIVFTYSETNAQKLIRENVIDGNHRKGKIYNLGQDRLMIIKEHIGITYAYTIYFLQNGSIIKEKYMDARILGKVSINSSDVRIFNFTLYDDVNWLVSIERMSFDFSGNQLSIEDFPMYDFDICYPYEGIKIGFIPDGYCFFDCEDRLFTMKKYAAESYLYTVPTNLEFKETYLNELLTQYKNYEDYYIITNNSKKIYSVLGEEYFFSVVDSIELDTIAFLSHFKDNRLVAVTEDDILIYNNDLLEISKVGLPEDFVPAFVNHDSLYLYKRDTTFDNENELTSPHTLMSFNLNTMEIMDTFQLEACIYHILDLKISGDTAFILGRTKSNHQLTLQTWDLSQSQELDHSYIDLKLLDYEITSQTISPFSNNRYRMLASGNISFKYEVVNDSLPPPPPITLVPVNSQDNNTPVIMHAGEEVEIKHRFYSERFSFTDAGDSIIFIPDCVHFFGLNSHLDINLQNSRLCIEIKFPASTLSTSVQYSGEKWSFYPNPAAENIHINLEKIQQRPIKILVLNLHGKLINAHLLNPGESNQSIQTSDLIPGMYFIQLIDPKSGQLIDTQKLIKQ